MVDSADGWGFSGFVMTWTSRIVLGFVLAGESVQLLSLALGDVLRSTHPSGLVFPVMHEWVWALALLLRATEPRSGAYIAFVCLLVLPPLVTTGYAYSRFMRTPFLRATRSPWVRMVAGATVALIVAFALDVIAHWWNLRSCHVCSVPQHFPPARLLHFMSRFLKEFGLTATVVGALCALVFHRESWDEYVKLRGLQVGQLPEAP
jgi:hypothetical protein